jgi:hypothetical protein
MRLMGVFVMAGFMPAIHLARVEKGVDGRDERGHEASGSYFAAASLK